MKFLDRIKSWANPIDKALDIIKEAVPDGDKRAELKAHLEEVRANVYMAELGASTIPWVDALHKMGRQIQWAAMFVLIIVNAQFDLGITDPQLGIAGGLAGVYQAVKGRGR